MKKKLIEAVDQWDGVLDPIPFTPKARSIKEFTVFTMMDGYEKEAKKILKDAGLPLTLKELLTAPRKERRIRDIMRMMSFFRETRIRIDLNDSAGAALSMAYGMRAALQARIRPVERSIKIGENHSQSQRKNRKQRKTWDGKTRDDIQKRNQEIIEHFKKTKLKVNSFAIKYAEKYERSPELIRKILPTK